MTIGDFIPEVRPKLGGRTDIDDRITQWLKEAYREIGMGYDLETLELTIEDTLTTGTDTYDYPDDVRAIKSVMLLNGVSPVIPTRKDIRVVRRYQITSEGVPSIWAPFKNQYILRPVPDQDYPITLDCWMKPIFDDDVEDTEVLIPDDWQDILTYLAAEKGHQELQESDKAQAVHQIIHGDPNPAKGWPGMIKERMNQNAAENVVSNYGIRPRIRPYGSCR